MPISNPVPTSVPVPASEVNYLLAYLDEYYHDLNEENREVGEFLYKSSQLTRAVHRHGLRLLDVACGPSGFYWSLFHSTATSFQCLDIRKDSIDYLRQLVANAGRGEVEERYLEVAHSRVGGDNDDALVYVQRIARRFGAMTTGDLSVTWDYPDASFEMVVSCFGIDHVENEEQFLFALSQARRVLVDKGVLTLVTLCETGSWRSGDVYGTCLYMTRQLLHDYLTSAGFAVTFMEECRAVTAIELDQGYEKMLFCRAVKS